MNALDDAIHAWAARTLGLITRVQVLALGGSDAYIRGALERRRWQQLQAGVYLTGSAPPTWLQRQLAACLAAGPQAWASHRGAAAVWGLDGAREGVVELTSVLSGGPRPRVAIVHRTKRCDACDVTAHRQVPVTSVNRTLIDYGAVVPPILVERAVEDAFNRRLTNEGALRRRLAAIGGPGCRGSGRLRRVLDGRPEGRPARSGFEVMLLDVIRQFGLPIPVRNHVVVDESGRPVAELDLAYIEPFVGLEAQGARWHTTARARRRDAARREVLERLGCHLEYFTWDEVVHHPEQVAARIRAALAGTPTDPAPAPASVPVPVFADFWLPGNEKSAKT